MSELDNFLGTVHHFSDGLYAKEMRIPKGATAISHKHTYSHLSILSMGEAAVEVDGETKIFIAPCCIEIKAGIVHKVIALKDVVWFCIHATDEKDISAVDAVLVEKGK